MNDKNSKLIDTLISDINSATCDNDIIKCIHRLCNFYENGIIGHNTVTKLSTSILERHSKNIDVYCKLKMNEIRRVLSIVESKHLENDEYTGSFKSSVKQSLDNALEECYARTHFNDLIFEISNARILNILTDEEYTYYIDRALRKYAQLWW